MVTISAGAGGARGEVLVPLERNILIPASLDGTQPPFPFGDYHTLGLRNWSGSPTDASLQSLWDAVCKKVAHPSSEPKKGTAIEDALDRPREEAEFWRSISQSGAQDPEEYRTYIRTYGEHGLFVEIARLRMSRLARRDIAKALAGATAVIALLVIGLFMILPRFKVAPIPNPPVVQNGTTLPLNQALSAKEAPVERQPKKEKTPPLPVVPPESYESPESLDDTLVHQLSDPRQLSRNSELFSVEWPIVLARLRATPFGDRKKAIVNALLLAKLQPPFRLGGTSVGTGFDSPRLLSYILSTVGVVIVPRPGERASDALMRTTKRIEDPRPGDLVFYTGDTGSFGLFIVHAEADDTTRSLGVGTLETGWPGAVYDLEMNPRFPREGYFHVMYMDEK